MQKNLQQHIADYTEAVQGYQNAALEALRNKIGDLKANPLTSLNFHLDIPRSYEKSYKQVIRMMEMETREEVDLTIDQFGCFVMDDWTWKQEFSASSTRYKGFK